MHDFSGSSTKSKLYSRSTYQGNTHERGTVVPEMMSSPSNRDDENQSTPIVGFLYSVSRNGIGEYWPLHLGVNKIGRSGDCDICLKENTVSLSHAELFIKRMVSTHELIASVKDCGSKNGIFINDVELRYEIHECANNDVITIGQHYKLLLILIDTEKLGLTVDPDFIPEKGGDDIPSAGPQTGFNPYDHNYRPLNNVTRPMNSTKETEPGGTKFM